MKHPNARLLIFAKAPIPGEVKTRLIPALGASGAANVHRALLQNQLHHALAAELCPVELWVANDLDDEFITHCAQQFPITLHTQSGRDLGERMANAFASTLSSASPALLIGSDCIGLDAGVLQQAFDTLHTGFNAVFVPADDGGYVAVGLDRPAPALFDRIPWGTSEVMHATRHKLHASDLTWCELPSLWDVDRPEDLNRLQLLAPQILAAAN